MVISSRHRQMKILDIAQIGVPEIGQKMQRKSSAAKVSISLCEYLSRIVAPQSHSQVVSQAV
jgi:hypothetical protein